MNGMLTLSEIHKTEILLSSIRLHSDLQPRTEINESTVSDYAQYILDGAEFPPPVVFCVDDGYLLADGFHRYFAHEALGVKKIAVEILDGSFTDAIAYSVRANTKHGQRRNKHDTQRAYQIALHYGLIDPQDVPGVAAVINVSSRWAFKLTEADREVATQKRNAEIRDLHSYGKTQRQIGAEVGVDHKTVSSVLGKNCTVQNLPTTPQLDPLEPISLGIGDPVWEGWSKIALFPDKIRDLPSVDWLKANRSTDFDYSLRLAAPEVLPWLKAFLQFYEEEICDEKSK